MLVDRCAEKLLVIKMADFSIVRQLALQKRSNKSQSVNKETEGSVLSYKDGLDLVEKERYIEKIRAVKGQDPYEIVTWSRDNNLLPNITYIDIINYLVFKPSPYTAEELRCYKGLDAYNQFVNGWVRDTGCCIVNERCILTAKVRLV
ncbi:Hemicentin-1 [Mactra antiquata]